MLDNFKRWFASRLNWMLAAVTALALLPFLAKPFNMDDPLFVWTAKQIQSHPANPYGLDVNWYGELQPMWRVTENPPAASYFLALAAMIFGWNEIGLHVATLIAAIAAVLGTYRLAKRFCRRPIFAALATLLTPVFLVSSTTIMCDVPMLAFWIWAMVFWIEGLEKRTFGKLLLASVFISLAVLTKYFGACLLPLLAVYSCLAKRKFPAELAFLLIPVAALCLYEWATRALYGHALFFEAAHYAKYAQGFLGVSKFSAAVTALAFTGGCFALTFFLLLTLWSARMLVLLATASILISLAVFATGLMQKYTLDASQRMSVEAQFVFWVFGGISILAFVAVELWQRRDADSCLLFLWVMGIFVFTAGFNWTVNARSLLPMAPAIGILFARQIERVNPLVEKISVGVLVCFIAGAALALAAARADFLFAVAARQNAQTTVRRYGSHDGTLWAGGHWGFQFYMEQNGAMTLDMKHSNPKPGDFLALPSNNDGTYSVDTTTTRPLETISINGPHLMTTLNRDTGAGFYAASFAPLPFAFGHVPPENVFVYELKPLPAPASPKN